MTRAVDPPRPDGAISYAQWLVERINAGGLVLCGPPVYDWPTAWQRFWATRPNYVLELRLERQLREVQHQAEAEAG
jgi:hypothetical protein